MMEIRKLFLGSLLSVVVLGKGRQASQKAIVTAFMRSLDPDFPDDYNVTTKLAGGLNNPSGYIMDAFAKLKPNQYGEKVEYFSESVIPLIIDDKVNQVIAAICLMVKEDDSIADDDIVELVSGVKKKDLECSIEREASFLTGIFFYVLKNTKNNRKPGEAKTIAHEYFERAKNYEVSIKLKAKHKSNENENKIRLFEGNGYSSIGIAALLTIWDDNNKYDRAFVEKISTKNYNDVLEDLRLQTELAIEYDRGKVRVKDSQSFRYKLVEILDLEHMKRLFDILMDMILTKTNFSGMSSECISGVFDFIAFFGCNRSLVKRINSANWKNLMYSLLDTVLDRENGIKCISEYLDVIVEADADIFISVIENKLQIENNLLNQKINENANLDFIYPLAYALRKAAAPHKTFSRAICVLFTLSCRRKIFFDNMRYVLNPIYLQTEASFNSRKGVLRNFFLRDYKVAWKCLMSLLPENNKISSRRVEFKYLPICFQTFSNTSYEQEINEYVDLACAKLEGTMEQIKDIVPIIPFLPEYMADKIVDAVIRTTEISQDAEAIKNWMNDWLKEMYQVEGLEQNKLKYLYTHFTVFVEKKRSHNPFAYIPSMKRDESLKKAACDYMKDLSQKGVGELYKGMIDAEDKAFFAEIAKEVVPLDEMRIFIKYLGKEERRRFRPTVVNAYKSRDLIAFLKREDSDYIELLCEHRCDHYLMEHVNSLSEANYRRYWNGLTRVDLSSFTSVELSILLNKLIENENFELALNMVYVMQERENLDVEIVLELLEKYILPEEIHQESFDRSIIASISNAVMFIQQNASDYFERVADIEAKYIKLMDYHYFTKIKNIFIKMANNPEYVEKLIIKKRQQESLGQYDTSASILLRQFKIAPGSCIQGSFDFPKYLEWLEYAQKSDINEMMDVFMRATYHVLPDKDGFFMDRNVAEFIERDATDNMLIIFEIEAMNSIGPIETDRNSDAWEKITKDFLYKSIRCEEEGYLRLSNVFRDVSTMLEDH